MAAAVAARKSTHRQPTTAADTLKRRRRYRVVVTQESRPRERTRQWLAKMARAVFRRFNIVEARLELALVSDRTIAQVNRDFLGHAGPTDVLTFNYSGEDGKIVGEIVISTETAAREARRRGHAIRLELALYLVHGILHLLGYDDSRPSQARLMHGIEDDVLAALGCGTIFHANPITRKSGSRASEGCAGPERGHRKSNSRRKSSRM